MSENAGFYIDHSDEHKEWKVYQQGQLLLNYQYGIADDPCPSFIEVKTPKGHDIVLYRPWDHVWHTGLFFNWKYINGYNVWESFHAKKGGYSYSVSFVQQTSDGKPGFLQELLYEGVDGIELLKEKRSVFVQSCPNGYLLRTEFEFTSADGQPVVLDRTPYPEYAWGGYAGLSCRLQRNLMNPVITTDKGTFKAEESHGESFKWCDYSGKVDGYQKRWAGIAMINHVDNPRYPTAMITFDYKALQFLQSGFLFRSAYTLQPTEKLHLKYDIYIHDGQVEPAIIEERRSL